MAKDGEKKLRLFVAIELPAEVKENLATAQQELAAMAGDQVHWTPPEQIHLTLLFLGGVASSKLPALQNSFTTVCASGKSLALRAEGFGCFPNARSPSVLWCGVSGDTTPLEQFQKRLSEALAPWCEKIESRPFQPHLTIGRVRERGRLGKLAQALVAKERAFFGEWQARNCSLMQSHLSPHGALHSELQKCPLL
jgi:2'-5' RNA ligase